MWLRYDKAGNWTISNTGDKEANNGNCVLRHEAGVFDPSSPRSEGVRRLGRLRAAAHRDDAAHAAGHRPGLLAATPRVNGVYHPRARSTTGRSCWCVLRPEHLHALRYAGRPQHLVHQQGLRQGRRQRERVLLVQRRGREQPRDHTP